MLTIVLGSKNYSSWSLRPWLVLEHLGVPYEEIVVPLDRPTTEEQIRAHSPSGRVPALIDGDLKVWDSLAICEYLSEKFPKANLWPEDPAARAMARSVAAEMHSGFAALRQNMTMNVRALKPGQGRAPGVDADITRICEIWRECRSRFGAPGEMLFSRFTIADAMFAPVVTRFRTYGVRLDEVSASYADAVWQLPAMQKWVEAAKLEEPVARYE